MPVAIPVLMKPQEPTPFVTLDELALSLITGGDFNPDTAPSGEGGLTCTQVFAQGHCSTQCVGGLLEDWKRLKGQQPPAK